MTNKKNDDSVTVNQEILDVLKHVYDSSQKLSEAILNLSDCLSNTTILKHCGAGVEMKEDCGDGIVNKIVSHCGPGVKMKEACGEGAIN